MFLRKLMVIVVPLLLCALLSVLFPFLSKTFPDLDFFEYVLDGLLLGVSLAMLIPLMGGRRRDAFAGLYFIPAILLLLTVIYQYLHSKTVWQIAALAFLGAASPTTILLECTFLGFLACAAIRSVR